MSKMKIGRGDHYSYMYCNCKENIESVSTWLENVLEIKLYLDATGVLVLYALDFDVSCYKAVCLIVHQNIMRETL